MSIELNAAEYARAGGDLVRTASRAPARRWRGTTTTAGQREHFIAMLEDTGNVRASAHAAGVTRWAMYRHARRDPDFAMEWVGSLELAAEAMVWQGRPLDRVSDAALAVLAEHRMPEEWGESSEFRRRMAAYKAARLDPVIPTREEMSYRIRTLRARLRGKRKEKKQ